MKFFRSNAAPLVIFCVLSMLLEENYPISNYPMYSGISPRSHYFYITDQEGEPISIRKCFGKSASAIKKMHGAFLNGIAEEKGTRAFKLGWEEQVEAGQMLLDQLKERGERRGHWRKYKPESIRLIRVDIGRDSDGIVKDEKLVLEVPAAP